MNTGIERGFYKRLAERLKLSAEQVKKVRALVRGEVRGDDASFPNTEKLAGKYPLGKVELALSAVDEVIGTYGVETFELKGRRLWYCNTGETYNDTVLFWRGKFRVGSWGDLVEYYDR